MPKRLVTVFLRKQLDIGRQVDSTLSASSPTPSTASPRRHVARPKPAVAGICLLGLRSPHFEFGIQRWTRISNGKSDARSGGRTDIRRQQRLGHDGHVIVIVVARSMTRPVRRCEYRRSNWRSPPSGIAICDSWAAWRPQLAEHDQRQRRACSSTMPARFLNTRKQPASSTNPGAVPFTSCHMIRMPEWSSRR